jgi:dihydrofolate synthase/folylpolyglutamate synthase
MQGLVYLNSLTEWNGKSDFSIDKLRPVLNKLGDPDGKFIPIHVAGTNGKGSVSTFIASILGQSNQGKVGLYTSPHLERVNERIVIDGLAVGDAPLNSAIERVLAVAKDLGVTLSYFEILTVAAFLLYAELGVRFAVVEVGLGGRLDATNILLQPKISVITSIDFDHMSVLGNTLTAIAREKAGIIRPGVPVVVGAGMAGEALTAIKEVAAVKNAPVYTAQLVDIVGDIVDGLALKGSHQRLNAATAAQAAKLLGVGEGSIVEGIKRAWWPGRIEKFTAKSGGEVVLDAAHNPDGAGALSAWLSSQGGVNTALFAVVADKDWKKMIEILLPQVSGRWVLLRAKSARALDPSVVADHLSCLGITNDQILVLDENYTAACDIIQQSKNGERFVVCGSMYMMGEIRKMLSVPWRALW